MFRHQLVNKVKGTNPVCCCGNWIKMSPSQSISLPSQDTNYNANHTLKQNILCLLLISSFFKYSFIDFRDSCFASTQCKVYGAGETWSLAPFCGASKCVKLGRLINKINDRNKINNQNNWHKQPEQLT